MDVVEGGTGSYNETCVECDVDGTEEISIKVEESIDIKEEVSIKVEGSIDIKEEVSIKVEGSIDIKEEVSIKVEESVDIKEEIPEAVSFPPIKTEHEVRLGVCERWFAPHAYCPRKEIVKLHLTISCFVLCFGCHISLEI
jgi:hypothetical protein